MSAFHFISGLPRSGSTLLAAILLQNRRFRAGMSSPVGTLLNSMLAQFSAGSEFGPVIEQEQRRRLLRGLFENYYADQLERQVVFDSNRLWYSKLPALLDLYPSAKIIACVRLEAVKLVGYRVKWKRSGRLLVRNDPSDPTEFNGSNRQATNSMSADLDVYDWGGRTGQRHRKKILSFLGLRRPAGEDLLRLRTWLTAEALALDVPFERLQELAVEWFARQSLAPLDPAPLER